MKKTTKTIVRAISLTLAAIMIAATFAGCTRISNQKLLGNWGYYEILEKTEGTLIIYIAKITIEANGNLKIISGLKDSDVFSVYEGKCFEIGGFLYIDVTDNHNGERYTSLNTVKVKNNQLTLTLITGDSSLMYTTTTFTANTTENEYANIKKAAMAKVAKYKAMYEEVNCAMRDLDNDGDMDLVIEGINGLEKDYILSAFNTSEGIFFYDQVIASGHTSHYGVCGNVEGLVIQSAHMGYETITLLTFDHNLFPYEETILLDREVEDADDYLDIPWLHLYEVENDGYSEGIENENLWNEQFTSDIYEIVNNAISA